MSDVSVVAPQIASAPQDYVVPGAQEILLKAVACKINGSSANSAFLPALQMLDPAGHVMWTSVNAAQPVAAGGSAVVSWFPGSIEPSAAVTTTTTTPTAAAGAITTVTSTGGTLSIGNPTGPTTNVDMPATGVGAATYGDSTHVARLTVDAEGRLTAASSVAISGSSGAGGLIILFDSTLGAPAASIDTGAGGIASGHKDLVVMIQTQTADAAATANIQVTFNNDTGANYDIQYVNGSNVAAQANVVIAGNNYQLQTHGSGGTSGYAGFYLVHIPSYDQTTFFKTAVFNGGNNDNTGANQQSGQLFCGYRSTAAISRMKVAGATANLVTGSRLTVYGVQ